MQKERSDWIAPLFRCSGHRAYLVSVTSLICDGGPVRYSGVIKGFNAVRVGSASWRRIGVIRNPRG